MKKLLLFICAFISLPLLRGMDEETKDLKAFDIDEKTKII